MDAQKIQEQIDSYKKKIDNPAMPESAKEVFRKKVKELEEQLTKASTTETKEVQQEVKEAEKQVKEETETQDELEKTITKAEKVLGNKSMPESAKKVYKKKLDDAKEKLSKIKKESSEDKKEVKKKVAKKTPSKPRIKKIKEIKKRSKLREKKIERIMSELETLVERSKKLKKRYSGQGVDLEKDAVRRAKPFGYRYKGKHNYRVVTLEGKRLKNAIKSGRVYKETRPNKADSIYKRQSKKTYPMLEEGGMMKDGGQMEKGGQMAKGGLFKDSRYNYGRSWTLDHKQHNKSEDYEIPMKKRKK